jgi:hypothetical protein
MVDINVICTVFSGSSLVCFLNNSCGVFFIPLWLNRNLVSAYCVQYMLVTTVFFGTMLSHKIINTLCVYNKSGLPVTNPEEWFKNSGEDSAWNVLNEHNTLK